MTREQLDRWAQQTAEDGRLLSQDELQNILFKAGMKLLEQVFYERVESNGA